MAFYFLLYNQPFRLCSVVLPGSHRHFLPSYYIASHFLPIRLPSTGPVNQNTHPHTLCSVPPQPLQMMCRTPANCMHLNCQCSSSRNFNAIHPSCLQPFKNVLRVPENWTNLNLHQREHNTAPVYLQRENTRQSHYICREGTQDSPLISAEKERKTAPLYLQRGNIRQPPYICRKGTQDSPLVSAEREHKTAPAYRHRGNTRQPLDTCTRGNTR